MSTLEESIRAAINRASAEQQSDTPDYILARYLLDCLAAFGRATRMREQHNNPVAIPAFLRKDGGLT